MRRPVVLCGVVLLLLAAALTWRAPASLLAAALRERSGGHVLLAGAEGTVWRGHGVAIMTPDTRVPIAWRVHFSDLLRGRLHVDVTPALPAAQSPRAEVILARRGVALRDLSLRVPASAVLAAIATGERRPPVEVRGRLDLATRAFEWAPGTGSGTLDVQWSDAAVGAIGAPLIALGQVSAALQGQPGRISSRITNVGGEVAVAGTLNVESDGGGSLRITVHPRHGNDPRIAALAALGSADGNGARLEWRWRGR